MMIGILSCNVVTHPAAGAVMIVNASFSGVPELVYARIVLTGIMGLGVTLTLVAIESRLLFWHASHRRAVT